MGLFKKKQQAPRVHQPVPRTFYVPSSAASVRQQLVAYSEMFSPKVARPEPLHLAHVDGWTVVSASTGLHPWAFHNLGFWLLDTPSDPGAGSPAVGTVLRAGGSVGGGAVGGYTLVPDPELDSCLCGQRDNGTPLTVYVPENRINETEAVPQVAAVPVPDSALLMALAAAEVVSVLLEDPGHDLNPDNEAQADSRRTVVPRYQEW